MFKIAVQNWKVVNGTGIIGTFDVAILDAQVEKIRGLKAIRAKNGGCFVAYPSVRVDDADNNDPFAKAKYVQMLDLEPMLKDLIDVAIWQELKVKGINRN